MESHGKVIEFHFQISVLTLLLMDQSNKYWAKNISFQHGDRLIRQILTTVDVRF